MSEFYERQLFYLAGFCVFSMGLEHYTSAKRKRQNQAKESPEDRLEHGKAASANLCGTLTRQYLVVYAIVMGAPFLFYFIKNQWLIGLGLGQARIGCRARMSTRFIGSSTSSPRGSLRCYS